MPVKNREYIWAVSYTHLLGDQFVYMLFVKYICPTVLNCFQQVAHIPFFIHEKHSYGIQSLSLIHICQIV